MSVDHLAAMQANTISQFKAATSYQAILAAIGDQLNDVEEFFGQIIANLVLPNAVGPQLDALGGNLNQGRDGLSDSDYRTILQARVVQYQGNGTIEDILQILITLGGSSAMTLTEYFPARFQVILADLNPLVSTADLAAAVLQTKLAGVSVDVFIPAPTNPQFTFDHAADATHDGFDLGHLSGPII